MALAKNLPVDRERPVCELGCGWGESLEHLRRAGFTRLVDTEASQHRAAAVRAALDVSALTGAFESAATQRELAALAPYSIIVSSHVLEHTYAPADVIAAAASLQQTGDYLIIAMPNQEGEPPMGVLFFLPACIRLPACRSLVWRRASATRWWTTPSDAWSPPSGASSNWRFSSVGR